MSASNGHDPAKPPVKKEPVPITEPVREDEYRMGYCGRCGGDTIHRKTARGYECTVHG